jgi:low affinity Fe/Cu permease
MKTQSRSASKTNSTGDAPARQTTDRLARVAAAEKKDFERSWSEAFSNVACVIARWMGKPIAFLIALLLVLVWAATGPMFKYSDTWQLVINTSTTIITFLMVFLIQNTQNRDTMAIQVKLSELILAVKEAENRVAEAEDMTDEELEKLHEELRGRAEQTLGALNTRRAARQKQKKAS